MNGLNVALELREANPAQVIIQFELDYPLGKYQSWPQGLNWFIKLWG